MMDKNQLYMSSTTPVDHNHWLVWSSMVGIVVKTPNIWHKFIHTEMAIWKVK